MGLSGIAVDGVVAKDVTSVPHNHRDRVMHLFGKICSSSEKLNGRFFAAMILGFYLNALLPNQQGFFSVQIIRTEKAPGVKSPLE